MKKKNRKLSEGIAKKIEEEKKYEKDVKENKKIDEI